MWAYPQICLEIWYFCFYFLILLTLNPHNFGQSGQNAIFFAHYQATEVMVSGGKSLYHFCHNILSLCNNISWARKVKMRHCKRQKLSSRCGQYREGCWEGLTPSGWSERLHFMGNLRPFGLLWLCFQCLPNNWTGFSGERLRDRQGWPVVRMTHLSW